MSTFFTFTQEGERVPNMEPTVKKTVIKSRKQLTYEEAQKVINGDPIVDVPDAIKKDILEVLFQDLILIQNLKKKKRFLLSTIDTAPCIENEK